MTRFASSNSGQQDVARFRARKSLRVTAHTCKAAMRVMIKLGVRHPLHSYIGGGHRGLTTVL